MATPGLNGIGYEGSLKLMTSHVQFAAGPECGRARHATQRRDGAAFRQRRACFQHPPRVRRRQLRTSAEHQAGICSAICRWRGPATVHQPQVGPESRRTRPACAEYVELSGGPDPNIQRILPALRVGGAIPRESISRRSELQMLHAPSVLHLEGAVKPFDPSCNPIAVKQMQCLL